MLGVLAKIIGAILVIAGVLVTIAAPFAVMYGLDQQEDNESSGPLGTGEDNEETQQNGAMIVGGAVAGIVGVVATAIGIILAWLGAAGSNAWLRHRTNKANEQIAILEAS